MTCAISTGGNALLYMELCCTITCTVILQPRKDGKILSSDHRQDGKVALLIGGIGNLARGGPSAVK